MHTAYIGLGANLPGPAGPPAATMAAAAARLVSLGRVVGRSSLYSTTPMGLTEQPRFFNAVIGMETTFDPREMLASLLAIEREFGRDRAAAVPNGPRTLDLDILLFGRLIVNHQDLEIPHPRLAERGFVLVPLHEIAPDAVDPRTGSTVAQLLNSLFPAPGESTDAVVKVQSDVWRVGTIVRGTVP